MELFVRVLTVVFWVAATLLVAVLFTSTLSYYFIVGLLGSERLETLNAVLVVTVALCSGLIGWHEFRANPAAEKTMYGQGMGKASFYTTIFWIALFVSVYFVPAAYFDL
jgi:Na+/melibiose symporter-like transporter